MFFFCLVASLLSCAGDAVVARFDDGSVYLCQLNHCSIKSPLVARCVAAIAAVAPSHIALTIRGDLARLSRAMIVSSTPSVPAFCSSASTNASVNHEAYVLFNDY